MASSISSSETVTIRAQPARIASRASGAGTRVAIPSPTWVAERLVETGRPASTLSA